MGEEKEDMEARLVIMQQAIIDHTEKTNARFDEITGQFKGLHGHINRHIEEYNGMQKTIMDGIKSNQEASAKIEESVSGMVDWSQNLQGGARVLDGVQRFMLWLLKWGVIGGAFATGIMWLVEKFGTIPAN